VLPELCQAETTLRACLGALQGAPVYIVFILILFLFFYTLGSKDFRG